MSRIAAAVLALALALAAAGCGGDDGDETAAGTTTAAPPPATTAEEPATTASEPDDTEDGAAAGGAEDLPAAGTDPVAGEPTGEGTAQLTDVRLGRHEGYDRAVFAFDGHRPGHRVGYVERPIREDGSGNPVEVEGEAVLEVRFEIASAFDLDAGVPTFEPKRISGADPGTEAIAEVVSTGDFEGVLRWVVGLRERAPFRVLTLDDPPRVVVDVVHGG